MRHEFAAAATALCLLWMVTSAQEEPIESEEPTEFEDPFPFLDEIEREEIEGELGFTDEDQRLEENAEAMDLDLDLSPDPSLFLFAEQLKKGEVEIIFEGTVTQDEVASLAAEYGISSTQLTSSLPILGTRALIFRDDTGLVLAAIKLPDAVRRLKRKIEPEVRLFGTNRGIAVEYRGWHTDKYIFKKCTVIFEYQVNVVDRNLASKKTFGRIKRPYEYIKVLTQPVDGTDGLYVLVVPTVEINKKKIGQPFTETHFGIVAARGAASPAKNITIDKVERWLVVEHELVHAEQIYRAYSQAVRQLNKDHKLCNPTRPLPRHRAILTKTFTANWAKLVASGHGGGHEQGRYPNTPAETEAREVMWRLWDARPQQGN